jgi:hypothetical protein
MRRFIHSTILLLILTVALEAIPAVIHVKGSLADVMP